MVTLELEFQTNANSTGLQKFIQLKTGKTPEGKNVYIYQRTHAEGKNLGKVFGFEVVIPNIKKAGTYPLPGGKSISYPEDFEEYPGASLFGIKGWFFHSEAGAAKRFEDLCAGRDFRLVTPSNPKAETSTTDPVVKRGGKGRPKVQREALSIPEGEFSVKEMAEKNGVEYVIAFQFIAELESNHAVKRTRTERRAAKGKATQLFQKI